ncbi:glutaredoxin family protein [Clostridium sp.]|uniref:glutaredoxin family protein n=1 Tax=Clostridium sp. TaxID=1506 RepID=UPI002FC650A8
MNKVEIYTSDTCVYCHRAKEFFEENNISYIEHNISRDAEVRKSLMLKGYRSVPLIVINNVEVLGFDRDKISDLLKI